MLLFSLVGIYSSCKKKKNDPTPSSPPSVGVTFSWNGTSVPLNTPIVDKSNGYYQVASDSTTSQILMVKFPYGKPTETNTYLLEAQYPTVFVYYCDINSKGWNSLQGTVKVSVNQGFVTSSFSNIVMESTAQEIIGVNNCSITTK